MTSAPDDLAPSSHQLHHHHPQQHHRPSSSLLSDHHTILPHPPRPCAHPPAANEQRHDSTTPYLHAQYHQQSYKKSSSLSSSSTASSSIMTYLDLEKPSPSPHRPSHSHTHSHSHSHDPEKGIPPHRNSTTPSTTSTAASHALSTLLFLSGPHLALSLLLTLYSLLALLLATLTLPLRLCTSRPPFSAHLTTLLTPTLHLQLRCIYARTHEEERGYKTPWLLGVHLLSPVVAFGVMGAAWVVGVYWVGSRMVGDPGGCDGGDDGRETVLGLRGWWEGWLMGCIEEESVG